MKPTTVFPGRRLFQVWTICILVLVIALAQSSAATAVPPQGYRLDPQATVYEVPPQKALDLTDEVTLEAWVQADRMGHAGGRILDKAPPGTSEAFTLDTFPGNSLRFGTLNGHVQFDARLPSRKWSYVAAVYSASKRIQKLYLNGKEVASGGSKGFPRMSTTTTPLLIGADSDGGSRFCGRILRAAIYGRAHGRADRPAGRIGRIGSAGRCAGRMGVRR